MTATTGKKICAHPASKGRHLLVSAGEKGPFVLSQKVIRNWSDQSTTSDASASDLWYAHSNEKNFARSHQASYPVVNGCEIVRSKCASTKPRESQVRNSEEIHGVRKGRPQLAVAVMAVVVV